MKYSLIILTLFLFNGFKLVNAEITDEIEENIFYQAMQNTASLTTEEASTLIDNLTKGETEVEVVEQVAIPSFHNQEKSINELNTSLCSQCHNQWPHEKNTRLRSMLNMHNKKLACEACHFTTKQQGKKNDNKEQEFDFNFQDLSDKTSLIIPLYKGQPALIAKEHPYAKHLKNQWQSAINIIRDDTTANVSDAKIGIIGIYSKVHKPLVAKDDHIQCDSCHQRDDSYLDLTPLINDKERLDRYQNNIISNFFSRYKKDDQKIQIINILR